MINLYFTIFFSCGTDVSIMKRDEVVDSAVNESQQVIDTSTSTTTIETETQTTQEPSGEPVIEGTGGYINYYLRQVACPACVGESQEITVEFNAEFHEPTTSSHTEWIPEVGTCTDWLLNSSPSTNPVDVGQYVDVMGPNHSFQASKVSLGIYRTNLYETQYDRVSGHAVKPANISDSFNFQSIEGFDFIEPYEMLYIDPTYAFAAPIYRSGMTFTWSPYDTSRLFMITIAVYTPNGSQLLGYAACVGTDQGFMTFPGHLLTSYPPYSLAAIHLARHKIEFIPYQPLNSYIEAHMEWEVVGTGYIY